MVAVGKVMTAFGVRGHIKILPFSPAPESVLKGQKQLWLGLDPTNASVHALQSIRRSGDHFIALIDGVADRDAALAIGRPEVWVSRAHFPATQADDFYWVDLIGCTVVNRQAERLGLVVSVDDHGAHALLSVSAPGTSTFLIPFVDQYIDRVGLPERAIYVDWQSDYV